MPSQLAKGAVAPRYQDDDTHHRERNPAFWSFTRTEIDCAVAKTCRISKRRRVRYIFIDLQGNCKAKAVKLARASVNVTLLRERRPYECPINNPEAASAIALVNFRWMARVLFQTPLDATILDRGKIAAATREYRGGILTKRQWIGEIE